MTLESTYPISAREASVLEDAQRLYIKTHTVLLAVNAWARGAIVEWPTDHWYTSGKVKGALFDSLFTRGELILVDGSYHPAYLEYGAATRYGEAWFTVRVVTASDRNQGVAARVLDHVQIGPEWERPGSSRTILEIAVRAVTVEHQDEAEAWFKSKLLELQAAGFFKLALTL